MDEESGNNYEHRRGWIEDRLRVLSSLFAIEICAYAVMSNHYHVVVKLIPGAADKWSDAEVLNRWTSLFRGPLLVQRHREGIPLNGAEMSSVRSITSVYRERLKSLSWFMKCLNEPIARRANAEDDCTGHFWEARFQSQALVSDRALLAAMTYVDLNPVRAGISKAPESSRFTSIYARLKRGDSTGVREAADRLRLSLELHHFDVEPRPLAAFSRHDAPTVSGELPIRRNEYLKLVDATGRRLVRKHGRIEPELAPILKRLGLSEFEWLSAAIAFRQHYRKGDLRKPIAA